jgi:hypothetical protein
MADLAPMRGRFSSFLSLVVLSTQLLCLADFLDEVNLKYNLHVDEKAMDQIAQVLPCVLHFPPSPLCHDFGWFCE